MMYFNFVIYFFKIACFYKEFFPWIDMIYLIQIQAAVSGDELQIYGAASAVAEEVLSSIRTVVSFGGEQKEIDR